MGDLVLTIDELRAVTRFVTESAQIFSGIFVGLVIGVVRFALSAWGQWVLFARLWLPLTRRLPWRPKMFLEDAYERGVLRRTGAVYQFRHAQLRDHLAKQYRR
ncbi:hypothetical protein [Saccharopolyspora sp. SCSIO 74807]|uniref:hypothetical protein n=1 Tax=Saccharopolyspora sp. SCSIO 74807 TaxID=3118084 RepID=UPI0030CF46E2